MQLLRMLGCAVFGHAPIAERRGADCVLACERCHRLLEVFVKDLYADEEHGSSRDGPVGSAATAEVARHAEDIVVGPTAKCEDQTTPSASGKIPLHVQVTTFTVVIVPFLGLVAAFVFLWGRGFSWLELALLLGMYVVTVLGITVGFHRLFTHRSFETNSVVQFLLAALGSMAVQGPLLEWVALHRRHHQHSDREDDPHSPHHHGRGLLGLLGGLWHAHLGWFFQPSPPNLPHYVKDLRRFASLRLASALFPAWVIVGLLIPAVLAGLFTGSWTGALFGLLWGGLARIFLVHHVTWSINSVCHLWGQQPYPSNDHSRNNVLFGILGLGEGWHNNHHAFPTSARHGLKWWQVDVSYWVIRALALLGLAWNVRLPAK